jgi:Domain of unknown function (DUF4279)
MVSGSFDPAQITERMGIKPTKSSLDGDLIEHTKMARKTSRWMLHSRLDKTASLEEHVSDVLDQLDARKFDFKQLSSELDGVIELVGYFYGDYPGLFFDRDVIRRLSEYSLSMDCDFYYLASAEAS